MRPAARAQAAIELLDEIIGEARAGGAAADSIIHRFFEKRRYAGSGDRRAIRELVWRVIRHCGERPVTGRAAMLCLAQQDPEVMGWFEWSTLRAPIPPVAGEPIAEAGALPAWLQAQLDPLIGTDEFDALLDRAPLDLRVNRLRAERESVLPLFPGSEPTPFSPLGVRLPDAVRMEANEAWRAGMVDVQDEGSQLIALACGARPGDDVVDLCAGAGGKTLALAADMANQGLILACDADRTRLSRLAPRAQRAGATIIEPRLLDPGRERARLSDWRQRAHIVLVDSPCSGSGTWRRNPETRWRLTPERLDRLVKLQSHLLDVALELVRPGGHLVYAVCSLLAVEGRVQAEALGARRSSLISEDPAISAGRPCGPGRLLTPARDNTDGFFIARWRAP